MWMAVKEAKLIKDQPIRVDYWGIPVVLVPFGKSQIRAFHDRCPHRGAALSEGSIRNGQIHCPFHNWGFRTDGSLGSAPPCYRLDQSEVKKSHLQTFHVRESVGLIWISIVDVPFPIKEEHEGKDYVTGTFPIEGDLRFWLDHFLDATHCAWTHANTVFGNDSIYSPTVDYAKIKFDAKHDYPVHDAVEILYTYYKKPKATSISKWAPLLGKAYSMSEKFKTLRYRRSFKQPKFFPKKHKVQTGLVTPLCQETRTSVRHLPYVSWTSIIPGPDGNHMFIYSGYSASKNEGLVMKFLKNYALDRLLSHHLGEEDNLIFRKSTFSPLKDLILTEFDETVVTMRKMFHRYYKTHRQAYPESSFIHTLGYGDEFEEQSSSTIALVSGDVE